MGVASYAAPINYNDLMALQPLTIPKSITTRNTKSLINYFKEVSKTEPMTVEEERASLKAAQEGDKIAEEKVILSNLRFVISVAKQYQFRGVDFEDLIAWGNVGLLKAVQAFDLSKDVKFISYAVWWIRQAILNAIYQGGSGVRLPSSQQDPMRKMLNFQEKCMQERQIPPSDEEIADELGITIEKVNDLRNIGNKCVSTNTPYADDGSKVLEDTLQGDSVDPVFTLDRGLKAAFDECLKCLSARDHDVLCLLYGLRGVPCLSFAEVGSLLAVTGERIRQMHEGILENIRRHKLSTFKKHLFN